MKKRILIILMATMILTSCNAGSEKAVSLVASQIGEADKISKKDNADLTLSMRTVQTLNPLLNEEESVDGILRLMYKPLIEIDDSYKPVSCIAESWYYAEEGTLLTVRLKQGLTWHNGSSITADDVIFSLNTIRTANENAVYKSCISRITGYDKIDDYTITVKFDGAYVGNVYAMSFPLISSAYYGADDISSSAKNFDPVGNGAYAFESFVAAKELRLKATENSFSPKPQIENIVVSITTDADTDVYTFSQRITDCVVADESVLGRVDLDDGSKKYSYTDNYYDFLGFNFDKGIFNDKNLRKAIAFSVPVENIIESVYLSNAVKAASPLNPDSWLNSEEMNIYDYDLAQARQLLEDGGYSDSNNDNIREKLIGEEIQSLSLSLLVNSENDERCQAAIRIAEELNSIGFNIDVDRVDYETYLNKLQSRDYDMFMGGWELSIVPEFGFMFESGSTDNFTGYSSERMDSLILAYRNSVSEADMIENMKQLQKEITEELPYVSIVFRQSVLFTDERIGGEIHPQQFNAYSGIEKWNIS